MRFRELDKILTSKGWYHHHTNGSHYIYRHTDGIDHQRQALFLSAAYDQSAYQLRSAGSFIVGATYYYSVNYAENRNA